MLLNILAGFTYPFTYAPLVSSLVSCGSVANSIVSIKEKFNTKVTNYFGSGFIIVLINSLYVYYNNNFIFRNIVISNLKLALPYLFVVLVTGLVF